MAAMCLIIQCSKRSVTHRKKVWQAMSSTSHSKRHLFHSKTNLKA